MRLSTDTERLNSSIQTPAKSNQITYWTRRKSCHPSSRELALPLSLLLSLSLACIDSILQQCNHFNVFSHFPLRAASNFLYSFSLPNMKQTVLNECFFFHLKFYSECNHSWVGLFKAAHLYANYSLMFIMPMITVIYPPPPGFFMIEKRGVQSSAWLGSNFTCIRRWASDKLTKTERFDASFSTTFSQCHIQPYLRLQRQFLIKKLP